MHSLRRGAGALSALTLLALASFGCGRHDEEGGVATQVVPLNANDTVATVDKQSIPQSQFFVQLQNYAVNPQAPSAAPAGRSVLQSMIVNLCYEGLAAQQGVAPTDAEVNTMYDNIKLVQDSQTIKPFEQRLSESGLTPQDVKDIQLRPQLAQIKMLTKGDPAPTDADIKKYYDDNKLTQFTKPDRAHVKGIALANQADAQKIYKEIQGGQKFETFLPQSLNKQLVDGEFLQWVPLDAAKNPALAPLIKGINATAQGQTSAPVSFQGAWWLIQVVEKKAKETVDFDQVKTLIPFILTEQKAQIAPTDPPAVQQAKVQKARDVQTQEQDYQKNLANSGGIKISLAGQQYTQLMNDLKNPPPPQQVGAPAPRGPRPPAPRPGKAR